MWKEVLKRSVLRTVGTIVTAFGGGAILSNPGNYVGWIVTVVGLAIYIIKDYVEEEE